MALNLIRATLFFAVWHAFSFYLLFYVFPDESSGLSLSQKFIVLPITIAVSLLALTPLTLSGIKELSAEGRILKAINGPAIALFGIWIFYLVAGGIFLLIKKMSQAKGHRKKQFATVSIGVVVTFSLLVIFNFIYPAILDNARFVPLAALFMLPFIGFAFYAIAKQKLLDIKVIATEVITVVLAILVLLDVVVAEEIGAIILKSGIFALVLAFGSMLVRSVLKEVEQRERLEILAKELESTNLKLQELDKLKSQFLSFASHQIKAPMSVIKGYADLISSGDYGQIPEKVKETSDKIKTSADRMITLVNEFLDLRKIEEGKMEYNLEEADIVKIVGETSDEIRTLAKDKGLEIIFEAEVSEIKIKIDTDKIRQVIQNLAENSVKYTEKGWVKISIGQKNNAAIITVSDSGLGMSRELIPQLFDQFQRGIGKSRLIRGTGLGLYIAKQIVASHGGSITAESEGEGKGSKFTVKLPIKM